MANFTSLELQKVSWLALFTTTVDNTTQAAFESCSRKKLF